MRNKNIRKDDTVMILSGNDKGKTGKIIAVSPDEGKVIIEGKNVRTKHVKPKKQGEAGGIMKVDGAIYADKVALVCSNSKCENNGKATRVKIKIDENGNKSRVCAKCGKEI